MSIYYHHATSPAIGRLALEPSSPPPLAYGIEPSGFRLPGGTRLGRVRLQIADLERSRAYYSRVLGLDVLGEPAGIALLGVAGSDEPLVELVEKPSARPVPRRGRLGLFHFAILVPDRPSLGAFVRHVTEQDVGFGASDHLVSEAVYLHDPDGLGIEVYVDRPRESWRHQRRQLLMASDPMDLDGVLAAGRSVVWRGLPAGTRIGHIHLHVGDLERARRFYHEGLGLDVTVWSYPGALFLSADGYHHHLGLNTWAAGAPPAGDDEARLLDWELVVPASADVEEALQSIRSLGFDRTALAGDDLVADPWGARLRIRCETPHPGAT